MPGPGAASSDAGSERPSGQAAREAAAPRENEQVTIVVLASAGGGGVGLIYVARLVLAIVAEWLRLEMGESGGAS